MKSSLLTTVLAQINNRSGLKRIIANTGWLFADKFLALLAGLLVGAWIARYLGPKQYGQYNYALAFTALFAPFASLGLATIAVREFVRRPEDKPQILGTV